MEKTLGKLLFELSNEERMQILSELQTSQLKLSQITKKLEIAIAEASRHLQRLSDDGLIEKNVEGFYQLTQIGQTTLALMASFRFVTNQKEYLLQYDISNIPYTFINRIGELEKCQYIGETLKNLEYAQQNFEEAEQYIWILSDQIFRSAVPVIASKLQKNRDFEVRLLLPENIMPPENVSVIPASLPKVYKRTLPQIKTIVLLTEKYACVAVPTIKGKMDYTGFVSTDDKFRKWCGDLFIDYWEKAKPLGAKQQEPKALSPHILY